MCEPQKSGSLDMFLRQVSLTISFETVYWFTPSDIQNWFYVGLAGLSAGGRILTRGCCSSSVTLCPGNLTKNMIVSAANKFWTKWDYIMGKLDRIHGLHKQYRESLEIHVCGIVCHICGIVYHIRGIFDPQMWYSIPHMWYTQNFYFWILTMIPMPKIQKSFKE